MHRAFETTNRVYDSSVGKHVVVAKYNVELVVFVGLLVGLTWPVSFLLTTPIIVGSRVRRRRETYEKAVKALAQEK